MVERKRGRERGGVVQLRIWGDVSPIREAKPDLRAVRTLSERPGPARAERRSRPAEFLTTDTSDGLTWFRSDREPGSEGGICWQRPGDDGVI